MPQLMSPAVLGAMVRDARLAAGLSQTALGERIGASRYWIAEFERGKPTAELGLALKAVQALGLTLEVTAPRTPADATSAPANMANAADDVPSIDLGAIITAATGRPNGRATAASLDWPASSPARPR